MKDLQEQTDELSKKVDEYLGTKGPRIKTKKFRELHNYFFYRFQKNYEKQKGKKPGILTKTLYKIRASYREWEQDAEMALGLYLVDFPNKIFVNTRQLENVVNEKFLHVTDVKQILSHEITHARVWMTRENNQKYFTTNFQNSYIYDSLDEGFAYHTSDKIVEMKPNSLLKRFEKYRSMKDEYEKIGYIPPETDTQIKLIEKEFQTISDYWKAVLNGFYFCTVVEKELGKESLLEIALKPMKESKDTWQKEYYYKISEEEIKNPWLYVERIKKIK